MRNIISTLELLLPDRKQTLIHCLSNTYEQKIYLEDNELQGKTVFVKADVNEENQDLKYFQLHNPLKKEIILWAIDGCFVGKGKSLSEEYAKKCDCIFGYEQYLGFIEFKMNANPLANDKSIARNRKNGVEQLSNTVCFIRDTLNRAETPIYTDYTFEAFLCTPLNYPRKNNRNSAFAVEFLETYGVSLFEVNEKLCL